MTLQETIRGKQVFVFADEAPEVLLIEPMDLRDLEFLDRELETLKAGTERPFALAALIIEDWNNELAPWAAEPVFGKEPFGDGAHATLGLIEKGLVPEMEAIPSPESQLHLRLSGILAGWISFEATSQMHGEYT